jgi:hypothetical protein
VWKQNCGEVMLFATKMNLLSCGKLRFRNINASTDGTFVQRVLVTVGWVGLTIDFVVIHEKGEGKEKLAVP